MKKNNIVSNSIIGVAILVAVSCGNNNQNDKNNVTSPPTEELPKSEEPVLAAEYLGNYHGFQESYNLKNQYGDDMVINGNAVSVPSSDYKFLIKEKNIVSLQQINLSDNSRIYYNGKYSIVSENEDKVEIKCSLSDGSTSNPNYVLEINKIEKAGFCIGSNEPKFAIEKIK